MKTFAKMQCALTRHLNGLGHKLPMPARMGVLVRLYAQIRGEVAPVLRAHHREYLRAVFHDLNPNTDAPKFYASLEWKQVRYEVLRKSDGRCCCCGASSKDGARLHVDHIMPRSKFPKLALDPANLQVLCEDCNFGKGAHDTTDWRRADVE